MRVLITNNRLDLRGGAESYVRDLARGLQNLGHMVLAYSSDLGELERLLENDSVPVTTDLENLPFQPDIIHGQHHLDAMTAILSLPGVPAIYHCHGAVWRETPPKHPRIYRYLAMSRTLKERMMAESNIAGELIDVHFNGVDVESFLEVRSLPERPRRALFYNSHHRSDSPTLTAVREAAQRCGLELDLVGHYLGRTVPHPQDVLPTYDIVFASGRSAIDALASGCAVVVLGRTSCGEMITEENFERFRQVNFSIAANASPPSTDKIAHELGRYSAVESAMVTARLREEADSRPLVRGLVGLYEQVIAQHAAAPADLRAESLATARYFRRLVPLIKMTDDAQRANGLPATKAQALLDLRKHLTLVQNQLDASSP